MSVYVLFIIVFGNSGGTSFQYEFKNRIQCENTLNVRMHNIFILTDNSSVRIEVLKRPKKSFIPFLSRNTWSFAVFVTKNNEELKLIGTLDYNEKKETFVYGLIPVEETLINKCLEIIMTEKLEESLA